MRYAIPVSGGMVSARFGHCEHFALFDIDETGKKILSKELAPAPEPSPACSAWLAEQGGSLVIASGIGSHAQSFSSNTASASSSASTRATRRRRYSAM